MTASETIAFVLDNVLGGEGIGLFTTVSAEGIPHATWMATYAFVGMDEIVCLTSPDSQKVRNLNDNPRVEWLFTSRDMEHMVYLKGTSKVVEDVADFKRHWLAISNKSRAYFLERYNSPPGFVVVRTQIDKIEIVQAKTGRKDEFSPHEVLNLDHHTYAV